MSKSKVFMAIALFFAGGILFESVYHVALFQLLILLAVFTAVMDAALVGGYRAVALAAFLLVCFAGGAARLQVSFSPSEFKDQLETPVELEGYIVEDADVRTDKQFITIQPKGYSQRILATVRLGTEYNYGDWVVLQGKLKEPENFSGFDYRGYLERYNVRAVSSSPKILVLKDGRGSRVKRVLLAVKRIFVRRVQAVLEEPESSLLLGILIGAKKSLPQNLTENFSLTGTSHIVAVSGYNITIMIAALMALAKYLGRKTSFWLSVLVILSFVVITGASASVLRASVMGILLLIALSIGRQYSIMPAMFFAAFVMLVMNPKILYWDIGFQLSFAATLGIVAFVPVLEVLTERWGRWLGAKTILFTTLAAIAATLPLILLYFGTLSLVAPAVNILVLPVLPLTMLFGFLSIVPFLGPGFAFVAGLFLKYVIFTTDYFAHLAFSSVEISISPLLFWLLAGMVAGLYFMLASAAGRRKIPVEVREKLW